MDLVDRVSFWLRSVMLMMLFGLAFMVILFMVLRLLALFYTVRLVVYDEGTCRVAGDAYVCFTMR